ncbi:MAG: bile acid:sodium symporter family protein [Roseibacillus sp.]|nr:bile acid:sodium symporter family protein [Roseibacillus sp.]
MSWARTVARLFWVWTLLGTLWAWLFPAHFVWFVTETVPGTDLKLVPLGLGVIMLGMGLTLNFEDVKRALALPRAVAIGVGAQFLIMPFLGWSVATLFGLEDGLKLGLILVSCCPGGTASNVVSYLARANVALSVLMTMCSTLLAIVLTPYLTKGYAALAVPIPVDAWAMVLNMLTIVLLPVVVGILLNRFLAPRARDFVGEVSPLVSIAVIVLIVGGIVGAKKELILEHFNVLLLAVFILHLAGFVFGYLWARLLRLGESERRTVSIEVGMQNSGLGATLADLHFAAQPGAAMVCAISGLYHCLIGSVLASIWRSRRPCDKVPSDTGEQENS